MKGEIGHLDCEKHLCGKGAISFRVEAALVQKMIFPNLAAPYHSTFPFLIRQA